MPLPAVQCGGRHARAAKDGGSSSAQHASTACQHSTPGRATPQHSTARHSTAQHGTAPVGVHSLDADADLALRPRRNLLFDAHLQPVKPRGGGAGAAQVVFVRLSGGLSSVPWLEWLQQALTM